MIKRLLKSHTIDLNYLMSNKANTKQSKLIDFTLTTVVCVLIVVYKLNKAGAFS